MIRTGWRNHAEVEDVESIWRGRTDGRMMECSGGRSGAEIEKQKERKKKTMNQNKAKDGVKREIKRVTGSTKKRMKSARTDEQTFRYRTELLCLVKRRTLTGTNTTERLMRSCLVPGARKIVNNDCKMYVQQPRVAYAENMAYNSNNIADSKGVGSFYSAATCEVARQR